MQMHFIEPFQPGRSLPLRTATVIKSEKKSWPRMYDSTLGKVIPHLSMFGDSNLRLLPSGELLTKKAERRPIHLGPSFFRKFSCYAHCNGSCCDIIAFTLDFFDGEEAWIKLPEVHKSIFTPRTVEIEGLPHPVVIHTIWKGDTNMREEDGSPSHPNRCFFMHRVWDGHYGCGIHETGNPLSCDSQPDFRAQDRDDYILVTKQPFGRANQWPKTPQCTFDPIPINELDLQSNVRIFNRHIEAARIIDYPPAIERLESMISIIGELLRKGDPITQTIVIP